MLAGGGGRILEWTMMYILAPLRQGIKEEKEEGAEEEEKEEEEPVLERC